MHDRSQIQMKYIFIFVGSCKVKDDAFHLKKLRVPKYFDSYYIFTCLVLAILPDKF